MHRSTCKSLLLFLLLFVFRHGWKYLGDYLFSVNLCLCSDLLRKRNAQLRRKVAFLETSKQHVLDELELLTQTLFEESNKLVRDEAIMRFQSQQVNLKLGTLPPSLISDSFFSVLFDCKTSLFFRIVLLWLCSVFWFGRMLTNAV